MVTIATERVRGRIRGVWSLLRFTFGLLPIIAGIDKFTYFLVDWAKYLNPQVASAVGIDAGTFMEIVGVIEIIAGVIVLAAPRVGGYIVALWLLGIVVNLLSMGDYYDIAVRDAVMAVGAFALARLTEVVNAFARPQVTTRTDTAPRSSTKPHAGEISRPGETPAPGAS